jgi:ABC-2 type transport system permease protein
LPPVAAAPIALLFGIAISHNLLGLDASSLWLELGTGIRLRHLLLGRALAAAPTLVTPVLVAALLTVAVRRDATALVPTLALSGAAAGVPLGVGALISVVVPFPVPDDSSPFGNHSAMTGRGCLVGLVHAFGLCVSAVLLSPVFAFAVMRRGVDVATVVGCTAWSLVVLLSGVWLGDRFSERRPGALAETMLNGLR